VGYPGVEVAGTRQQQQQQQVGEDADSRRAERRALSSVAARTVADWGPESIGRRRRFRIGIEREMGSDG
jgi:hypothetical protein